MSREAKEFYRREYNRIKRLLHTCAPAEKESLKQLFNYYYRRMDYE
jgi:hypothetical protein